MLLEPYDATSILYGSEGRGTQQCVFLTRQLEFAIQRFDKLYMLAIPEAAQGYIDYASFRRDIFIDEFFSLAVGDVEHIFSFC